MPDEMLEKLVLQMITKSSKGVHGVSPDVIIPGAAKSGRVSADAVREAIWRLADLGEIEFTQDRKVAIPRESDVAA